MPFNIGRGWVGGLIGGIPGAIVGGSQGGGNAPSDAFAGMDPNAEAANQRRDPYGAGVQWDQYGNPIGQRAPRLENAVDWQYLANQKAEQRRSALWNDAQGVMQQGQNLLSSYRPGGSAALASGIFGQRANLYAGQAASTEAPDMMLGYRQQKQLEADKEAKRAAKLQQIMGGIQTAANVVGAVTGAGGGSAAQLPQGSQTTAPTAPGTTPAGGAPGGGGGGPGMVPGGGVGAAGMVPGGGGGPGVNPATGGAMMAPGQTYGPPGPGGGVSAQGFGGPSGGAGGPVGGKGGGRGGPGAGAPGSGPGLAGMKGNLSPMVGFTPEEAAGTAYNQSQAAGMYVLPEWASDSERKSSANLFFASARQRLVRAMGSGYPSNGGNGAPYTPGEGAMRAEAEPQRWLKAEVERLRAAESHRFDTNQYSEPNDLSILKGGR